MKSIGRVSFFVLVGVTLFLGMVMLYFGIRFKGYRPANNIQWLPAREGLCFKRYAIAYTGDFFPPSNAVDKDAGLSIEIVFHSLDLTSNNFSYLLSVYADDDRSQLLIGQWRHWIVVMNGADHDGRLGTRKVSVDISGAEGHATLLAITSSRKGTNVYLNGKQTKTDPKLQLFYPYQPGRTWLILGNSVYGRHPWNGWIAGLSMYDVALSAGEVMGHEAQWSAGTFPGIHDGIAPKIAYRFYQHENEQVSNIAGKDYPLHVPDRMIILKKEILSWREILNWMKWNTVQDMVINFLGFMPLGWILCATLSRLGGFPGRRILWLVVGLAFSFSLSLEIAQAWIPSRDSSLIDLILNTLGAAAGGWIYSVGLLDRFID